MIKNTSFILFSVLSMMIMTNCNNNQDSGLFDVYKHPDRKDHHSFANPAEAYITHLYLNIEADFDRKRLFGKASYDIASNHASEIILDTRFLEIKKVSSNDSEDIKFTLDPDVPHLGQALHIPISQHTSNITIEYSTTEKSAALQWLSPEQTTDKSLPFLFTQGQAILTRTWIPIQDSPGIRISYSADLKVPDSMLAVMSASNPKTKSTDGKYHFEMRQAIPAYLIALAVGDLEFGAIGDRTGVYAEPGMLQKSLYEFEDMEKMLELAEGLYGPYLWDRYDVIVLPASFPFGGMENPRLTFATPTIIAGDKSLTALIAHELAHSWSGNLVTNATWNDFWLNEGFTVYFERRIMEALYGKDYASMLAVLGYQDLEEEVESLGHNHKDTHLKLALKGRDPDDGMTDIAYEKGAYFLRTIAASVGEEHFDQFLKDYFQAHQFQTITTTEFIEYLSNYFSLEQDLQLEKWIYGPGIPDNVAKAHSDKFALVDTAVTNYTENGVLEAHDWTTHEWLHFIRKLPKTLELQQMQLVDKKYGFSESGNSEILAAWLELSIRSGYIQMNENKLVAFLTSVGRRKFLTPLYTALKETGRMELAMEIYKKARKNYHSVSTQTMDELLGFEENQ